MTPLTDMAEAIGAALPVGIDLLLRATIVLAIIQLLLVALKRRSAAARHFVVTLGLSALVALPILMFALPDTRLAILPPDSSAQAVAAPTESLPHGTWKTGSDDGVARSEDFREVARAISATGLADQRALSAATGVLWLGENWQILALTGLTLIPILFLARILMGMVAVMLVARAAEPAGEKWMHRELASATRRLSVARPIRMLLSDRINVPLVWGFLRPVLILPASSRNWSRERFRVVILHEVAHVRRFDVLSLMVGRLATALYWFHPLSWMVEREGRRECERACDDLVLRTGARASDYADHLLGIAAGEDLAESYASVTLAMARPSELEGRLVSILRAEGERAPISRRAASISAVAALVLLLPISTVRLTAGPVEKDEPQARPSVEATVASSGTAEDVSTEDVSTVDRDMEAIAEMVLAQQADVTVERETQSERETELVGNRKLEQKRYESEGEKWYDTAYELHRQDRFDEAIAAFRKSIENGYRVGTSMYNIGCGYAMKGDVENAVRWIDDAFRNGFTKIATVEKDSDLDPIRSDPRFRGLLRDLRAEYGSSGHKDRFDEAISRFADLRANGSRDAAEWADAGLDLLRLRQLDDSIDALEQAVALEPQYSSVAEYNLACAWALKGDSSRALDALEQSILHGFDASEKMENDPDLRSIRNDRRFSELRTMSDDLALWGEMKKGEGNWKEWDEDAMFRAEIPRFESAVAKYPDAGRAWFNLGYATLRAGDFVRARTAFTRSLDLEFKRATSMYNLACVEALTGNRDAAIKWLFESEKAGARLGNMREDDDLESLRDDPRYQELLQRAIERNQKDKQRKEEIKMKQKMKSSEAYWL